MSIIPYTDFFNRSGNKLYRFTHAFFQKQPLVGRKWNQYALFRFSYVALCSYTDSQSWDLMSLQCQQHRFNSLVSDCATIKLETSITNREVHLIMDNNTA